MVIKYKITNFFYNYILYFLLKINIITWLKKLIYVL